MEEVQADSEVVAILEDSTLKPRQKIQRLNALGYSHQEIHEIGFSLSEVYKACPVSRRKNQLNGDLPVVLKAGGGQEVISPEAIMRTYLASDGEVGEWMLRGMMLMRAAQMMVLTDVEIMKGQADAQAKMLKPIMDMMVETRKEQDAAAERARASSMDIAYTAAQDTAGAILGRLEQLAPKAPPPKDTNEMLTKRIDKMWDMMDHMMTQRMMPGYQEGRPPEGWEQEVRTYEAAQAPMQAPGQSTPQGWETENRAQEESHGEPGDVRSEPSADGGGEGGRPAPEDGDHEVPQGG